MYYTIYQITNIINNKIYVGMHITENVNDTYMGSGKLIKLAISKYGIDNFKKDILFVYDNATDMRAKEAFLVDESFCLRNDTYNLCNGGKGGFEYINREGLNLRSGFKLSNESRDKISKKLKGRLSPLKGKKQEWTTDQRTKHAASMSTALKGKTKSAEHKANIASALKTSIVDPVKLNHRIETMLRNRMLRSPAMTIDTKDKISIALKKSWDSGKRQKPDRPWDQIQADINAGMKKKDILQKYEINRNVFDNGIKRAYIVKSAGIV